MSHGRHKATERSSRHRACKPRPIASGLSARFRRLRFEGLEDRRLLTTTFTTPITIGAGNYSYDGQDIIVNDTTVTINGAHSFNSLQLVDDAVLTDSALASLNLTISNTLIVDSTSAISADGRGNGAAGGLGAGGNAGSAGGGGYGGAGGDGWDYGGASVGGGTYGSIVAPTDLGSGGGNAYYGWSGGAGGGAICLTVGGTLQVNGSLTANGNGGSGNGYYLCEGGCGSGGSIYVTAGTLAGAGTIAANGGNYGNRDNLAGGGGGGRIAIYFQTDTFTGTISAAGGSGNQQGGAGTVFTKSASESYGEVRIDNGGNSGAATPLPDAAYQFHYLEVRGNAILSLPANESLNVTLLVVDSGGYMVDQGNVQAGSVQLQAQGTWELDQAATVGQMEVFSGGLLTCAAGQAAGLLTVTGNLTVDAGRDFGRWDGQRWGSRVGSGRQRWVLRRRRRIWRCGRRRIWRKRGWRDVRIDCGAD